MSRRVTTAEITSLWAFIALIAGLATLVSGGWLLGIGLLLASALLFFYPVITAKKKKPNPEMVCPKCQISFQIDTEQLRGCPECNWPFKNKYGLVR